MTTPRVSFEVFPPTDQASEEQLWNTIRRLEGLSPAFLSITYGAGGTTQDRTDQAVRRLRDETSIPAAAHITCVGASRTAIDRQILDWREAGIDRIVALRGDPPRDGGDGRHPEGYRDAVDLVAGLKRLGGLDISVAAYPEPHPKATSAEADLAVLKAKFEAGADRALTQFFFDPDIFLRFRDAAARAGISGPIVPGILPITDFPRLARFAKRCGATVPSWLADLFDGLEEDPVTRGMVAVSAAYDLCARLREEGVDEFHFFTLNRADLVYAVCWRLGLREHLDEAA